MEDQNKSSELQSYLNEALSNYTEYLATQGSTPCQRYTLIALKDKQVQEHFLDHIKHNELFEGTKCLYYNYNESKIVFIFKCIPSRICFIPPAFLVKLDIEHSKVIEIIDPYVASFLIDTLINDISNINSDLSFSSCTKIGPFVGPRTISKLSNGKTVIETSALGSSTYIQLKDIATHQTIYDHTIPQGGDSRWGYSPDDKMFFHAYLDSPTAIIGYIHLVIAQLPKRPFINFTFDPNNVVYGFGPDSSAFLLVKGSYVTVYSSIKGRSLTSSELINNWGQWIFSPCGDLFVLIGKNNRDPVQFYKLDFNTHKGHIWSPTSNGTTISVNVDHAQGPPSLEVINQGPKGIKLTGMSINFIDNPP